jgi:hypothetical protein
VMEQARASHPPTQPPSHTPARPAAHLWVPARVVQDDDVGRGEIDALPARARGDEVDEGLCPRRVERLRAHTAHQVGRLEPHSIPIVKIQ